MRPRGHRAVPGLAALETLETLLEKRRRRVMLIFAAPRDLALFAQLPGVTDVVPFGNSINLRLSDGIDGVINWRRSIRCWICASSTDPWMKCS